MRVVLLEPAVDVEEVELLAPQHAGQRLAVDPALVLVQGGRRDPVVELVGLGEAAAKVASNPRPKASSASAAVERRRMTPPAGTSST